MKKIELKDLVQQFHFKFEERLHAHLLEQESIKLALPKIADWRCENVEEVFLEKNRVDAKLLQASLQIYFAKQENPFELSEGDLIKLAQTLVFIAYFKEQLKILILAPLTLDQQSEVLTRSIRFENVLPITMQNTHSKDVINLDYLMPMLVAALSGYNQADLIKIKLGMANMLSNFQVLVEHSDMDISGPRAWGMANIEAMHSYIIKELTPQTETLAKNKFESPAYFSLSNALVAEEDWVNKVIASILWSIENKQSPCLNFYAFQILPERVNEYVELQHRIAKLIPIESHRPTIIIHFLGKNRQSHEVPDLGLLGGMGHLSDAHIMESMLQGNNDNANILLISATVPNLEDKQQSQDVFESHKAFHLQRLHELRRAQCRQYAMLSNAAHLHQLGFKMVTGNIVSMVWGSGNIINLVYEIAKKIKKDIKLNKRVMILATTESVVGDLYFSLLKRELNTESIFYQFGNKTPTLENLPDEQRFLQQTLQQMKKNEVDQFAVYQFYSQISDWILLNKPTHVLLACTEMNLLLSKQLSTGLSIRDSLRTSLGQYYPQFIDTEEYMVNILNEARKSLEALSELSALTDKVEGLITANDQQINVKQTLLKALKMEDQTAAIDLIKAVTEQKQEFDKVQTYFGGPVSANSFYGRFANFVGTTRSQPGQQISNAVAEVLQYLESRQVAFTHSFTQ